MKIKEILTAFFAKKTPDKNRTRLRREYDALLNRLSDIRHNFNYIDNPSSIDALIFEENATLCRLQQLIAEAKSSGMRLEAFELDQK